MKRVQAKKRVYDELIADVETSIRRREFLPGDYLPSEKEMTERYGISRLSVRRALTELQAQGLIEKRPGKGTFVRDPHEQGMGKGMIGISIPQDHDFDNGNPFLSQVHKSISSACFQLGYRVELLHTAGLSRLSSSSLNGLICVSYWNSDITRLNDVARVGIPVVLINRVNDSDGFHYVTIDHREWARRAVEYLIGLGHRRIALAGMIAEQNYMQERVRGYQIALAENGIPFDERLKVFFPSAASMREQLDALLRMQKPTAIFIAGGFAADALLTSLYRLGYKIPDSVSVVCFDEVSVSLQPLAPPMTVVRQPLNELGRRAVDIIDRVRIGQVREPVREVVQAELVIRNSCRMPGRPADDAKAP